MAEFRQNWLSEFERRMQWNEENGKWLKEALQRARKRAQHSLFKEERQIVTPHHLCAEADLKTTSVKDLQNYLAPRGSVKILPPEDHKRMVKYVHDSGLLSGTWLIKKVVSYDLERYFFHAWYSFLGVKDGSHFKLIERAQGTYQYWRPSNIRKGWYVHGMLQILAAKDLADPLILRVVDIQRKKKDKTSARVETHRGFMVRLGDYLYVLSRDEANEAQSSMQLHRPAYENSPVHRIVNMHGVVNGTYKNRVFSAPIYIDRWDADPRELDGMIDIVQDIPEEVETLLSGIKNEGVILF